MSKKRLLTAGFAFACLSGLLVFTSVVASDARPVDSSVARRDQGGTLWYEAAKLGLEGKGWNDTTGPYHRFPARAESMVRDEVWSLSRNAAGICLRFRTDADSILASWDGGGGASHFAPTGVSGLDLYRLDDGEWRFLAVGRPDEGRTVRRLAGNRDGGMRDYLLYLPLYNEVTSLEIGLPAGASLFVLPPPTGGPVVFYGTSIVQGGCASRPGMAHAAILGRRLDREVINLGFSGNGRMEPEVAGLLAELDPALYVIDCIPNVGERIGELTVPFVRILREARPDTPILLVENVRPTDDPANVALRKAFRELTEQGDSRVFLMRGQNLLGAWGREATVDGVHPTDLGFALMADAMEPVLRTLLGLAPEE